ncbi:hypothetical protein ACQU0X_25685 [Pseudovibrio ascidiaceicola]|uniref:hypothetical protein n=1 Tax=Pseudovibrio ascidiaceicola TaxID=285279 RepID=UPI003D36DD76
MPFKERKPKHDRPVDYSIPFLILGVSGNQILHIVHVREPMFTARVVLTDLDGNPEDLEEEFETDGLFIVSEDEQFIICEFADLDGEKISGTDRKHIEEQTEELITEVSDLLVNSSHFKLRDTLNKPDPINLWQIVCGSSEH